MLKGFPLAHDLHGFLPNGLACPQEAKAMLGSIAYGADAAIAGRDSSHERGRGELK
jgi:hypothetical protein